jgi:hypothetical protein
VSTSGPAYRTLALHEWHRIGPDGLPIRHRTIQVIKALRPGLRSYTYRFDRREATVHVVRGATPTPPYEDPVLGLTAVDLVFPRPLDLNETISFEYETGFRWVSVPPQRFRRAARNPVEHLDIRIAFAPERLPAEVQWALWDGFTDDAGLRAEERVELAGDHSVHRYVEELRDHTVGFAWTWPPGLEPVPPGGEPLETAD